VPEQTEKIPIEEGAGKAPEQQPDPGASKPEPELSQLLQSIRTPIPGENPCGKDVSYDEDYLTIKAEIDKLSTVQGGVDQEKVSELRQKMDAKRGATRKSDKAEAEKLLGQSASVVGNSGGVDYELIKQRAGTILSEKSKDIRVASYLCLSLWQTDKFSGLTEGLSAIDILVCEFWDGLYPVKTRLTARKNAIEFLTSKLNDSVDNEKVQEDDAEPLERSREVLGQLQKQFSEKMPDSPPSLLGLSQVVEKCLRKVPKPVPTTSTSSTQQGTSEQQGIGPESKMSPTPSVAGELRTNQDAVDIVKKAAKFLREQNRKSPIPYRLVRSLRWDAIAAIPPNENGKTKMEPPAVQRRNYLAGLRDSGDWNKLLDDCEESFGQPPFHFWLDLQRMSVAALDAMGGEYLHVRESLLTELAVFLHRVPNITSLTFIDGTRFVDPATSDWIEEVVIPFLGSDGESGVVTRTRFDDEDLDAQFTEAKKVLDAGDLAGAIALLQASANKDNSRKSAFRRKLAMAALCMRGNQPAIARPIFENLIEEVDKFSIDKWEPALALEVLMPLHRCYESLAGVPSTQNKQEMKQLTENVFEKICRLDVGSALATTGAKPKTKTGTKTAATLPKPKAKPDDGEGAVDAARKSKKGG